MSDMENIRTQPHTPKPRSPGFGAGVGLRAPHVDAFLKDDIAIGFLEAHSENYFGGGLSRKKIKEISERYALSLHGVGLSLGRGDGLDFTHLKRLKSLVDEVNPHFVSEHLTWSAYAHIHVPDLLPLPYVHQSLRIFEEHVQQFQDTLKRPVLVENPSNYLAFQACDYTEPEFLNLLVERTGCGLLLDLNNIAVSAHNLGFDPYGYLDGIVADGRVREFHLAGYQVMAMPDGGTLQLDTHGHPVYPEVWDLYRYGLERFGDVPTLVEWDTDIPELPVLLGEAQKADAIKRETLGHKHGRRA